MAAARDETLAYRASRAGAVVALGLCALFVALGVTAGFLTYYAFAESGVWNLKAPLVYLAAVFDACFLYIGWRGVRMYGPTLFHPPLTVTASADGIAIEEGPGRQKMFFPWRDKPSIEVVGPSTDRKLAIKGKGYDVELTQFDLDVPLAQARDELERLRPR